LGGAGRAPKKLWIPGALIRRSNGAAVDPSLRGGGPHVRGMRRDEGIPFFGGTMMGESGGGGWGAQPPKPRFRGGGGGPGTVFHRWGNWGLRPGPHRAFLAPRGGGAGAVNRGGMSVAQNPVFVCGGRFSVLGGVYLGGILIFPGFPLIKTRGGVLGGGGGRGLIPGGFQKAQTTVPFFTRGAPCPGRWGGSGGFSWVFEWAFCGCFICRAPPTTTKNPQFFGGDSGGAYAGSHSIRRKLTGWGPPPPEGNKGKREKKGRSSRFGG